jgi:hypothetical protein
MTREGGSGWYSNKSRGMRRKAEVEASSEDNASAAAATRSSQTWAMLIKRVTDSDLNPWLSAKSTGNRPVEGI